MKKRPEISDEEIQQWMDFDQVLKGHRSNASRLPGRTAAISSAIIIVAGTLWWFLSKPDASLNEAPLQTEQTAAPDSLERAVAAPAKTEPPQQPIEEKKKPATAPKKQPIQPNEETTPVTSEYVEAEPVDGYPELYAYFQRELRYPVVALKDSIEGIVSVSFVIDKAGKLQQVKILDSLGEPFDEEAIRVIGAMPPWKPATINGKPVAARLSMPLTFQISKAKP